MKFRRFVGTQNLNSKVIDSNHMAQLFTDLMNSHPPAAQELTLVFGNVFIKQDHRSAAFAIR